MVHFHDVYAYIYKILFFQAIERDKQRDLLGQTQGVANPIGTNDFDYEDKQKTQESTMVYEGLHFNLAAENSKKNKNSRHHVIIYVHCGDG